MPTILSDPPFAMWLLLGSLTVILLAVWAIDMNHRKKLIAAIVGILLVLLLTACDLLFESPREECVRRMKAIVSACAIGNPSAIGEHLSERFTFQGKGKGDVLNYARMEVVQTEMKTAKLTDFSLESDDEKSTQIGFLITTTSLGPPRWVLATFEKEETGRLLTKVQLFNGLQRRKGGEDTVPLP